MTKKKRLSNRLAKYKFFRFFLNNKTLWELICKILLLVAAAYAYPYLCGLIFQTWLHIEHLLGVLLFIGITILVIYVIVLYLSIAAILRFIRRNKNKGR